MLMLQFHLCARSPVHHFCSIFMLFWCPFGALQGAMLDQSGTLFSPFIVSWVSVASTLESLVPSCRFFGVHMGSLCHLLGSGLAFACCNWNFLVDLFWLSQIEHMLRKIYCWDYVVDVWCQGISRAFGIHFVFFLLFARSMLVDLVKRDWCSFGGRWAWVR